MKIQRMKTEIHSKNTEGSLTLPRQMNVLICNDKNENKKKFRAIETKDIKVITIGESNS